jgi:CubicO group peptidase (beta-lactamase class C family)
MPTEFKNPTDLSRELLTGSIKIDDLRDARVAATSTSDSIAVDGVATSSSVSVMTFGDHGVAENFASEGAADDTIFCAGSMTKMVTAATMLRMTEEENISNI